jgi:predicted TPR repeat methyltransferase
MVSILNAVLDQVWPQVDKQNLQVLDAGCGTGLLGQQLFEAAYRNLYGFDLSPEMIEKAQQKGLYEELSAGVDLTKSLLNQLTHSEFDVTACVGVLTQGHVPPSGVQQLIEITRVGGLIALSARDTYVRDYAFDEFCDQLAEQGQVQNLYKEYGPLVGDTKGLFVVMQKN